LAGAIVLAVVFAFKFVDDERQRSVQAWQIRLAIVADSRTASVNEWVENNFAPLRELAENASLQLYVTELLLAKGDIEGVTDEPAQTSYLRNLLVATANRNGFVPPPTAGDVAANVEKIGTAGIGLVDAAGRPIVATPGMPPLAGRIRKAVVKALSGEPAIIDMYIGASGLPTIGFVLPVFALQGDTTEGVGAVVGVRVVDDGLFGRLKQPGDTTATGETYLVRGGDVAVDYLSPLADGTAPLKRSLARDTPDLAAAYALDSPGGFATKRDYAGEPVLVVSRSLAQLPWVLVRKISSAEALAATNGRLRTTLVVLLLIIGGISVTIYAIWRHGSSLRAAEAAERYRVTAERYENMTKFMRVVTNGQPTRIVAVDAEDRYTFANNRAAAEVGISPEDMLGKSMASVIGPAKAKIFAETNRRVMRNFAATGDAEASRETHVVTFGDEGGAGDRVVAPVQVFKSEHIPLRGDRDYPPAVLMVLDDITELTRERRRNEAMLHELIDTLVSVVDRRDPYSAYHSMRVAEVSRCIAEDMHLSDYHIATVDAAGRLMNLGKIFVPADVLTRNGPLSTGERALLAQTHKVSADLLRNVAFDGPVVETIVHLGEWWDGSGPLGLQGHGILHEARILAVANAFVAMSSPRAHRRAMTFDQISLVLMEQAGSKFDRGVVSALLNYVDNRGGSARWEHFQEAPRETGHPPSAPPYGDHPRPEIVVRSA
jgi:HD-GYP domain-containing protein (c-di-GMP phosphodiesterase class II)